MIAWLQKQSIGIRLCLAFFYCGSYYALLFGFGWPPNEVVTIFLLTVCLPIFGLINGPQAEMWVKTQMVNEAPADVILEHTMRSTSSRVTKGLGSFRIISWAHRCRLMRWWMCVFASCVGPVGCGSRNIWHRSNQTNRWRGTFFNSPQPLTDFDLHSAKQGGIVNMRSGSYVLSKSPDGKTLLTLETQYSVTTPLNGYLAFWGEMFLQDFHHAVLSVIKVRSEEAAKI